MYHHRIYYPKRGFPWIFVIVMFIIFSQHIPSFFIWIFGIIIFKRLIVMLSDNDLRDSIPRRHGYNSGSSYTPRSHRVPVNYVDDVPEYEKPENFTRDRVFCIECGQKVAEVAKFCSFCGTSLVNI